MHISVGIYIFHWDIYIFLWGYLYSCGDIYIPVGYIYSCGDIYIPVGYIYSCGDIYIPVGIYIFLWDIYIPVGYIYSCGDIYIPVGIYIFLCVVLGIYKHCSCSYHMTITNSHMTLIHTILLESHSRIVRTENGKPKF